MSLEFVLSDSNRLQKGTVIESSGVSKLCNANNPTLYNKYWWKVTKYVYSNIVFLLHYIYFINNLTEF